MRSTKFLAICLLGLLAAPAAAQTNAMTIVSKMKAALEPARASTRKLVVHVNMGSNETTHWKAAQARGTYEGANWMLTVVTAPPDAKGIASLAREKRGERGAMWTYLPAVRRVRKLVPLAAVEPFFGTDFTYADLGFMSLETRYKLVGQEEQAGVKAYKLGGVPRNDPYDSLIVAWVAVSNFLPVERDFYDPTRKLWRVESYGGVKDVQGVPTVMKLRMEDKEQGTSSEIDFSDVTYDAKVPNELFDPAKLSTASDNPIWQGTGG